MSVRHVLVVMPKTYLFLFDIVAIATSSQPHIHCLPQFCSDSACYLVCKRRHDSRTVLLLLRLVPIVPNDDTSNLFVRVMCHQSGQIEHGVHYIRKCLIYLTRKAFLEKAVVELVYRIDEKSYRECLKW